MADVSISLDLQAKQLYDDLQNVQTKFAGFASQVTSHGEKAGKGFGAAIGSRFGEIKSALTSTLGALGVGVGIGAIVAKFNQVIDKGSQIHDLAQKFQITAESLQLIGNAADLDDIPLQKVAVALNRIQVAGASATTPGSKVNNLLRELKISADTFASANAGEKFLQLSDAYIAAGQSGSAYAAIAQLIGTKNTDMLITMVQGRDKIQALGASMGIMSQETVNDLDKAGDTIKTFNNQLTVAFASAITGSDKLYGSADAVHAFLVSLREAVGLEPLAVKLGIAGAVKPKPKAAAPLLPGENIAPIEGTGYGAETRDVYRTGAAETPEESVKRVEEEAAVSERRRHLLNLQSALAEKGLTLGTASATDIAAEEGRLTQQEAAGRGAEATAEFYKKGAAATEEFYHPGKKLEEELGGLQSDEGTDQLVEQTDILKQIRDNTAEMGANQ